MAALILLAAFIAVPLLEIAVFIQVGGLLGLWPTLALVVLTALAGSWLLRLQGLATLNRARQQIDRGTMPARELFDGLCLLFAGALLLTPGFVTDILGLLLFVPAVRDGLRGVVMRHVSRSAKTRVWVDGAEMHRGRGSARERDIIDGDYREVAPDPEDEEPTTRHMTDHDRRHGRGKDFRP